MKNEINKTKKQFHRWTESDDNWLRALVLPKYSDEAAKDALADKFNQECGGIPISGNALYLRAMNLQGKWLGKGSAKKTEAKKAEVMLMGSKDYPITRLVWLLKRALKKGKRAKAGFWEKLAEDYKKEFNDYTKSAHAIRIICTRKLRKMPRSLKKLLKASPEPVNSRQNLESGVAKPQPKRAKTGAKKPQWRIRKDIYTPEQEAFLLARTPFAGQRFKKSNWIRIKNAFNKKFKQNRTLDGIRTKCCELMQKNPGVLSVSVTEVMPQDNLKTSRTKREIEYSREDQEYILKFAPEKGKRAKKSAWNKFRRVYNRERQQNRTLEALKWKYYELRRKYEAAARSIARQMEHTPEQKSTSIRVSEPSPQTNASGNYVLYVNGKEVGRYTASPEIVVISDSIVFSSYQVVAGKPEFILYVNGYVFGKYPEQPKVKVEKTSTVFEI